MSNALPSYQYHIKVVRVIDGDTLEVDLDLGFYTRIRTRLRLFGVNCPELNTDAGKAAREYVAHALAQSGGDWTAHTLKADKYGNRWDALVYLANGKCLNELLVEKGHAERKQY